jgi:long-chain acyl-CoA synthetase
VVPDFIKLTQWAKHKGIDPSPKELLRNSEVKNMISESICARLKNKFGGYEIPKDYILIEDPFSVENGMLTQTLKLKRRKVIERYENQIEAAYETT